MGEVVKIQSRAIGQSILAALSFAALVAVVGIAPAGPAMAAPSGSAGAAAYLTIEAVEMREDAADHFIDVFTSGPVVWTSYRDTEGSLVVEFPNSIPGDDLHSDREGSIASVSVETDREMNRPLTRLRIETRVPVEHSLEAAGDHLQVHLLPISEAGVAGFSYQPLEESEAAGEDFEPVDPSTMMPPAGTLLASTSLESIQQGAYGTPENPITGPPSTGVTATRLERVEVLSADEDTVIRVAGDGQFEFSFFSLSNPDRFVIDLAGAINQSPRATIAVGSSTVDRVRIAQFKPYPEAVSRVVFDLPAPDAPEIHRTSDGLLVRFGTSHAGTSGAITTSADDYQTAAADPPPAPPAMGEESVEVEDAVEEPPPPSPMETLVEEPMEPAMDVSEAEEPNVRTVAPLASNEVDLFASIQVQEEPAATSESSVDQYGVRDVSESEGGKYVGEPIDMSVRDADVVEVLRMFAQISGLNVVVQPGVTGTVTVQLDNVPWDQALEQILKINRLGFELEGNIMRVAPARVLSEEAEDRQRLERAKALSLPLRTIMRRLSYTSAARLAGVLQQGLLSNRGTVIVDARSNTLIIKELPEFMDSVIAIIENLDTPEPQVMIEARIVETTKRFTRTLGVAWGLSGIASAQFGNTTGLQFPNNIAGTGNVNLVTGGQNGTLDLSLGNVLNTFNLDIALQAAESEGLINILSAPKIAVLNNFGAFIQSGLQIPIQTVANNTVTVQFVNATLELVVVPHVTAAGTILMDIQIAKREPQLAFAVQGAANAPISTKEARTIVMTRDGGTTVIGGIYEVSTDQGEDRVPGLANIPIIGHLFRNKRRNDENEELLIFITPRVTNP